MWKKYVSFCVSVLFYCGNLFAQSAWMEWEEQVGEEENVASWREQYEELSELAEHPLNINTVTKEELEQLPFLSDRLIEHILYYVYKYGPLTSMNELWGVEGMDRQTQAFLREFMYVGPVKKEAFSWRNVWKYNKQEIWMRTDVPFNEKAGYADIPVGEEEKFASKRYYGDPFYLNIRYRFQFRDKIYASFVAEKDAGEAFFRLYNRKGFDFYSASVQLKDFGRLHTLVVGNYKASFGYGLVMNMGFGMGKYTSFAVLNRAGRGLSKYTSMNEANYLQGAGVSMKWRKRWIWTGFFSFRNQDVTVDNECISTLKTDGYHRLKKDLEKKNTAFNTLVGSNLSYDGKYFEGGFTVVYNVFNKMLNPVERLYNRYYPRGKYFYNVGVNYKWYKGKFIFSGETAVDKQGKVATLNQLTYSPAVNTSLIVINRYYDKKYQSLYAYGFGENSKMQNEAGIFIGLETSVLRNMKLLCYGDFFYFPWYRYLVDKQNTTGGEGVFQISYSPSNSLEMLIKYGYKNKAKNYKESDDMKYVLPNVRQRLHYQVTYSPVKCMRWKTMVEYVRSEVLQRKTSNGLACGSSLKVEIPRLSIRTFLSGVWFHTEDYASRIYAYEQGLLYAFSMMSLYGKGERVAWGVDYDWKKHLFFQMKWGWTHYRDRNLIGSGAEEIQGNNKCDLQFQVRFKW